MLLFAVGDTVKSTSSLTLWTDLMERGIELKINPEFQAFLALDFVPTVKFVGISWNYIHIHILYPFPSKVDKDLSIFFVSSNETNKSCA